MASHRIVARSDHGKHRPEDHPHAAQIPTGDTPMPPRHTRPQARHAQSGPRHSGGCATAVGRLALVPTSAVLMHVGLWAAVFALLVLGLQLDAAQAVAGLTAGGAAAFGRPGRAALHAEPHQLAGKTVKLQPADSDPDLSPGDLYRVEDWWDRVSGGSWMLAAGNPAALKYAIRSAVAALPMDDEVVYGKDEHGLGHIVHVSELVEPSAEVPA